MWGGTSHTATKVEDGWRIDYAGDVAFLPAGGSIAGTQVGVTLDGQTRRFADNGYLAGTGSCVIQGWLQCPADEWEIVQAVEAGCFTADSAPY